jgi:hypothetical protein
MRALLLFVLLVLPAFGRAEPVLVVADCQVRELDGERWLVRLRSTGAQAFDVSRDGGDVVVPEPAAFGALVITEDAGGVVVRVVPSDPGWRVTAGQGGSANEVELRIGR